MARDWTFKGKADAEAGAEELKRILTTDKVVQEQAKLKVEA